MHVFIIKWDCGHLHEDLWCAVSSGARGSLIVQLWLSE